MAAACAGWLHVLHRESGGLIELPTKEAIVGLGWCPELRAVCKSGAILGLEGDALVELGRLEGKLHRWPWRTSEVVGARFSEDGDRVMTVATDAWLGHWALEDGRELPFDRAAIHEEEEAQLVSFDAAPGLDRVLVSYLDLPETLDGDYGWGHYRVRVLGVPSGQVLSRIDGECPGGWTANWMETAAALGPGGQLAWANAYDQLQVGTMPIHFDEDDEVDAADPSTRSWSEALTRESVGRRAMRFLPDGRLVVADNGLWVWSPEAGLQTLAKHHASRLETTEHALWVGDWAGEVWRIPFP